MEPWTTDPIYLNHCLTLPASIHQDVRRYSNYNLHIKCVECLTLVAVYKWKDIRNDLVVSSSIVDTAYTLRWSIDYHYDKPSPIVQL